MVPVTASIGKITDANKGYHLSDITEAVDAYYLADRHIVAVGRLAVTLELPSQPSNEQVINVLSGLTPDGSSPLRERATKNLGFDLVFSARKEISILHALGGEHIRTEIEAAHAIARTAGIDYATWSR